MPHDDPAQHPRWGQPPPDVLEWAAETHQWGAVTWSTSPSYRASSRSHSARSAYLRWNRATEWRREVGPEGAHGPSSSCQEPNHSPDRVRWGACGVVLDAQHADPLLLVLRVSFSRSSEHTDYT